MPDANVRTTLLSCVQLLNERITLAQTASLGSGTESDEGNVAQNEGNGCKPGFRQEELDARVESVEKVMKCAKHITSERTRMQLELKQARLQASSLAIIQEKLHLEAEQASKSAKLEEELGKEKKRADEATAQLKAVNMKASNMGAEIGQQSLKLAQQADELATLKEQVAKLTAERDDTAAAAASSEQRLSREVGARVAMESRLQSSVPKNTHDEEVRALESKLSANNARMIALDKKFKQLWAEMKEENIEVRAQAERERAELTKEKARATREEARAKAAVQQARELEARVARVEQDSRKLRDLLKSVKEQSQIMRTIARIRTETDDTDGVRGRSASGAGRTMGFDALVQTIDKVHNEVERQCTLSGLL